MATIAERINNAMQGNSNVTENNAPALSTDERIKRAKQDNMSVPATTPAAPAPPNSVQGGGAPAPQADDNVNLDSLLAQRTHVQNEKETLRNKANWLVSGGPAKEGITFVPQGAVDEVWARYDMYDQWEKELNEQIAQAHAANGGLDKSVARGAALLDAGAREDKKSAVRAKAQADADALASYTSTAPGSDLQNMALLLAGARGKESAEKRAKELDFVGERLQDTYKVSGGGQFEASMDLGRINQESNKAWNDYFLNPTEENRERAFMYVALAEQVQHNAADALGYDSKAKWLTQSVAGYLPQFWDQLKAQVKGGVAGAVAGSSAGLAGMVAGARVGASTASSQGSYENMRGQAFRDLVMMGVDEATAREAASDEAFISALIEGIGTYASFGRLGFDDAAKAFVGAAQKTGKTALSGMLGKAFKAGVKNAAQEYAEEFSQEGVSIANQRRMESGGETGRLALAGETAKTIGGALTGQNPEALKQMHQAGTQGALLGGLSTGATQVVNQSVATVAPRVRAKVDPLVQAIFGNQNQQDDNITPGDSTNPYGQDGKGRAEYGLPQEGAETTALSPQDGAGARIGDEVGVDTAAEQNPAQAAQEPNDLVRARFGEETKNAAPEVEAASSDLKRHMEEAETLDYTYLDSADVAEQGAAIDNAYSKVVDSGRSVVIPSELLAKYEAINKNPALKLKDAIKEFYDKHLKGRSASVELNGGVITVMFENDGKKKSVGWRMKPDKAATFERLVELVDGAEYAYSERNRNPGEASSIPRFHYFVADAVVGGQHVPVKIQVRDINTSARTQETHYYYHNLQNKRGNDSPGADTSSANVNGNAYAPSNQTPQGGASDNSVTYAPTDVNSTPEAAGSLPQGVGAAEADFLTPDSHSAERTSNLATGAAQFTGREGEATGLERADYDQLFRYKTETEAQRRQMATNMLYFNKDGERVFLGDIDREGYQEMVDYLTNAPAWNGIMTETAMLIKNEMQGRALLDPMFPVPEGGFGVTQEDYAGWLRVMREHATETGRGTQAWAAWTRRDNEGGEATELEAWDNLQESHLSDEERREVFAQVVRYDQSIEQAQTPEALRDIIMDIADRRGTTHGLTGKQSKRLVNRALKALDSLSFEDLKQFAYASSSSLTTDKTPADAGQKIKTIQVLNMLSNPKTTMTNLTGNTSFYGVDAMAMRGAALLDMALGKATGTRSVAMERLTGNRQSRADIAKAIQRSLAEITLDVNMGGENRYGQSGRRTFKADGAGLFGTGKSADRFVERVLSVMERNMGYALTTTDEAYKGAARNTAHATQRLMDEGKIKTENTDYAKEQADSLAKYRTFQKDGYIANALQVVHDWLNAIPFLGIGDSGKRVGSDGQLKVHSFGVGDLVAPFTRVAGNLVSTAIDYNPAKAVQGTVEIVDTIRKAKQGDIDPARQAKAVSDTARGLTGTAISLAAMALAKAGVLKRAEDEDDEDVAALNQSEGMTGTQLNIDAAMRLVRGESAEWQAGDTLVDTSRLEPLNFLFSFGVELADSEDDGFLSTVKEAPGDAGRALVSAAGDLPVMGTVAGVAKDTLVYGDDLGAALTENLGKTAVSSVTPNWLAGLAKGLDDKQRSTYSGDNVGDVLVDTMLSRIPGLRETLPASVNSLGEEKKNPGNLTQRLLNAMVNPLGVNEYSQNEVSQEMARVREQTGDTSFYPSKSIPAKVSYTKDGVTHEAELTYEQRQQYQMARSGAQMSVSAALIGSKGYKGADTKTKAALLDRAYDYANQFARGQVLGKDSMEGWAVNSQTAQADIGVSQAEFFCLYEKYGSGIMGGTGYDKTKRMVKAGLTVDQWATMKGKVDADGNGNVKKAEVETYIEGHFPRNQWRQIFDAYKGGSNWQNPY